MLDGSNFMQSGLVHGLRLHQFGRPESMKYVIMRKVRKVWIYSFQFSDQYYDNNYHESDVYTMAGETLSDYLNKLLLPWVVIGEASP